MATRWPCGGEREGDRAADAAVAAGHEDGALGQGGVSFRKASESLLTGTVRHLGRRSVGLTVAHERRAVRDCTSRAHRSTTGSRACVKYSTAMAHPHGLPHPRVLRALAGGARLRRSARWSCPTSRSCSRTSVARGGPASGDRPGARSAREEPRRARETVTGCGGRRGTPARGRAAGVRGDGAIEWRNPRIHTGDRVKVWLACDEHVEVLRDFLAARAFPLAGEAARRIEPTPVR